MDILINYILPFVGILMLLVVLHELGHYVTAKIFGIKVLEAGVGYPPRAWGFTWRGTLYSINWLPLGGFVRLLGEEDPEDPQSLAAQAAWKRLIVLASGSFMNLVIPVVLFTIVFLIPREVASGPAAIGVVMPQSPAAEAGLEAGDIIVSLEGQDVKNTTEAARIIRLNQGETIDFVVKRNDPIEGQETLTFHVNSRWDPKSTVYVVKEGDTASSIARDLGIPIGMVQGAADIDYFLEIDEVLTVPTADGPVEYTVREGDTVSRIANRLDVEDEVVEQAAGLPDPEFIAVGTKLEIPQGPTGIQLTNLYGFTEMESFSLLHAVPKGWETTWQSLILARNQVIAMFHGGDGPDVAGPVGIAQATGQVVEEAGWEPLLELAALLSINLAIINMLPMPMVDGGRVAFVLLEVARRGRRIAPEKEAIVHLVGFALIITSAVVVTYFDVARIIAGGSLFD